ncbi:MAG: hypothetical protein U1F56_23770 [Rubrivivax sp.]
MASIPNPFTVVGKAVRAFFKADVKLRRGSRGIEVVLDEREGAGPRSTQPGPGGAPSARELRERRELQSMQASLAALLDQKPGHRQALRHLAFIEHALERKGLRGLHKVPFDVLQRAHAQLDGLVTNWSDDGLAALRSRMAVTLIEREPPRPATAAEADPGPTESGVDSAAPLAHPQTLEGDEAAEAEAALLAAYGSVALAGLSLDGPAEEAAPERREAATAA